MKKSIFFFFLLFSLQAFSQRVAIKNNLVYDALLTPNLSLEFSFGEKWTLDTQVGMNFFFYKNDPTADEYKTKKWSHWLVQPEIRYWICERFNGWFLGLHAHGGQMNVGGINIPFILQNKHKEMKAHRYEGYFYGGGISAVTGTGKTKIAFIFQVVTIMVYLLYLYWLSHCVHAPLAVYMTTEYLFVIMLGIQSVIYLKRKHY